eukprot:g1451.t1
MTGEEVENTHEGKKQKEFWELAPTAKGCKKVEKTVTGGRCTCFTVVLNVERLVQLSVEEWIRKNNQAESSSSPAGALTPGSFSHANHSAPVHRQTRMQVSSTNRGHTWIQGMQHLSMLVWWLEISLVLGHPPSLSHQGVLVPFLTFMPGQSPQVEHGDSEGNLLDVGETACCGSCPLTNCGCRMGSCGSIGNVPAAYTACSCSSHLICANKRCQPRPCDLQKECVGCVNHGPDFPAPDTTKYCDNAVLSCNSKCLSKVGDTSVCVEDKVCLHGICERLQCVRCQEVFVTDSNGNKFHRGCNTESPFCITSRMTPIIGVIRRQCVDCLEDSDCYNGDVCVMFNCQAKMADGSECNFDRECISDVCRDNICAQCDGESQSEEEITRYCQTRGLTFPECLANYTCGERTLVEIENFDGLGGLSPPPVQVSIRGWTVLRQVQQGNLWHPARDSLSGSSVYGLADVNDRVDDLGLNDPDLDADIRPGTFSIKFLQHTFDTLLFTTGDRRLFTMIKKKELFNRNGAVRTQPVTVLATSGVAEPFNARAMPWSGLDIRTGDGVLLYAENSAADSVGTLTAHQGASVFARCGMEPMCERDEICSGERCVRIDNGILTSRQRFCSAMCTGSNYCGTIYTGSDGYLSCAQACHVRNGGDVGTTITEAACKAYCSTQVNCAGATHVNVPTATWQTPASLSGSHRYFTCNDTSVHPRGDQCTRERENATNSNLAIRPSPLACEFGCSLEYFGEGFRRSCLTINPYAPTPSKSCRDTNPLYPVCYGFDFEAAFQVPAAYYAGAPGGLIKSPDLGQTPFATLGSPAYNVAQNSEEEAYDDLADAIARLPVTDDTTQALFESYVHAVMDRATVHTAVREMLEELGVDSVEHVPPFDPGFPSVPHPLLFLNDLLQSEAVAQRATFLALLLEMQPQLLPASLEFLLDSLERDAAIAAQASAHRAKVELLFAAQDTEENETVQRILDILNTLNDTNATLNTMPGGEEAYNEAQRILQGLIAASGNDPTFQTAVASLTEALAVAHMQLVALFLALELVPNSNVVDSLKDMVSETQLGVTGLDAALPAMTNPDVPTAAQTASAALFGASQQIRLLFNTAVLNRILTDILQDNVRSLQILFKTRVLEDMLKSGPHFLTLILDLEARPSNFIKFLDNEFLKFAKKEFNLENVLFLKEFRKVQSLRAAGQNTDSLVAEIVQRFIATDALEEINIASRTRVNVLAAFDRGLDDAFFETLSQADKEIFALIQRDSFPRFKRDQDVMSRIFAQVDQLHDGLTRKFTEQISRFFGKVTQTAQRLVKGTVDVLTFPLRAVGRAIAQRLARSPALVNAGTKLAASALGKGIGRGALALGKVLTKAVDGGIYVDFVEAFIVSRAMFVAALTTGFQCGPLAANGQLCLTGEVCQTGVCDQGFCRECLPDGHRCNGGRCAHCCSTTDATVGLRRCGGAACMEDGVVCRVDSESRLACAECCAARGDESYQGEIWYAQKGVNHRRCGSEPRLPDGTRCLPDHSCKSCANPATIWYRNGVLGRYHCGQEPCTGDGESCLPNKSCKNCCNGHVQYRNSNRFFCGRSLTCLPSGSVCMGGALCAGDGTPGSRGPMCCQARCSGQAMVTENTTCDGVFEFWHTNGFHNKCGREPKSPDGTRCQPINSCKSCLHTATKWLNGPEVIRRWRCGTEPRLPDGHKCGLFSGTFSCDGCRNPPTRWRQLGVTSPLACGKEPEGILDGNRCFIGMEGPRGCARCISKVFYRWPSKA